MPTGTVKFFNVNKGFGFITGDDGKDYFVHSSGLKEGARIDEGDKVSFDVVEGDKGPKAENVEKATGSAEDSDEATEEVEEEASDDEDADDEDADDEDADDEDSEDDE